MKTKYLIRDIRNNTYFLGSNIKPIFGDLNDGVRYFDSIKDAEIRLNEESELFEDIFSEIVLEVVQVYIFE